MISKIFYKKMFCGNLSRTEEGDFVFEYEDDFLKSPYPGISFTLPKNKRQFKAPRLFPFFDNLIPEGWLLNEAAKRLRLNPQRDRFELLRSLCSDTIGAVHIGESIKEFPLIKKTEGEGIIFNRCLICYEDNHGVYHENCMKEVFGANIDPIINIEDENIKDLVKNSIEKRQSLTGVQKKLSLDFEDGHSGKKTNRLTITNLWGRFIFKPPGRPPHLPENEHLCLLLAQKANIEVEKCALIPMTSNKIGFLAKRFDRGDLGEEYHQEDFCQLLEKNPDEKYNGSYEKVGKKILEIGENAGDNIYRLFEIIIFNFLIGNVDFHLKNISMTYEDKKGPRTRLSPAYDLFSTDLYISDDPEQTALAINGKKNKLKGEDFLNLSQSFGIPQKVFENILNKFKKIIPDWERTIERSFLGGDKKIQFKKLIRSRLELFNF